VPVERLREWYLPLDLLGVPGEIVLDGGIGLADTVRTIVREVGPLPACPPGSSERFF
jgi:hypothetical protein